MNTCFLCLSMMVPDVPSACRNASLRRAYEALLYAAAQRQPVHVADYEIRLFERQKICLIQEQYNPAEPKISLTNSIETAVVQVSQKYGLCPAQWTFVEYANMGAEKQSYREYDLIVLTGDDIEWKYLWHSDCPQETEPYSDALLIQRVEQYRSRNQYGSVKCYHVSFHTITFYNVFNHFFIYKPQ